MTDTFFSGGLLFDQNEGMYDPGGYSSVSELSISSRYNNNNDHYDEEEDQIGSDIDDEDDDHYDDSFLGSKLAKGKHIKAKNIDSLFDRGNRMNNDFNSSSGGSENDVDDDHLLGEKLKESKSSTLKLNGLTLNRVKDFDSLSDDDDHSESKKNIGKSLPYMPPKKEVVSKVIKGRPPASKPSSSFFTDDVLRFNEKKTKTGQDESSSTTSSFNIPLSTKKSLMKNILSQYSAHKLNICNNEVKEKVSNEVLKLGEKLKNGEKVHSDDFFFITSSSIPSEKDDQQDCVNVLNFYKSLADDIDVKEL